MSLSLLLATELAYDVEQGYEVFGLSAPGDYVPAVEALGVTHVPLHSLSRSWDVRADVRGALELWRALRRLDLDVLHTHNPKTGVLGRVLGRLARVPVVVNTCHGLWASADDPKRARRLVLAIEVFASQWSHAELYQNDEDRRALSRFVRSRKQRTVGNGVDLTRFAPDPSARARVRAEWGVGDGELLVGGVGRLVAEKGIAEYAATARALSGQARFVWVGPTDEAKADAVSGGVEGVQLVGNRSDMPAVYQALDVFVLPSYREGFSRSGMEAAASGLPSVLSDIRGCREVGTHEQSLLLVPPRDPEARTAAGRRWLDDPSLRARLGRAAAAKAAAEFDQRGVAAVSVETYRAVAERKGLAWT